MSVEDNQRRFICSIDPSEVWLDPDFPEDPSDPSPTGPKPEGPQGPPGPDPAREQRRPRRENALKHGAYARQVPFISFGPLREDPEEVTAFYEGVEADLKPGASTTLRAQVREIANLQWRLFRLQKWEADGYSAPEGQTDVYEPDKSAHFALDRKRAADVLRGLGDPRLGVVEMRQAFVALVQVTGDTHLDPRRVSRRLRRRDQVISALIAFSDQHYGNAEAAANRLLAEARRHRRNDWDVRHWDSLVGARAEMSSEFTKSLFDAITRTSRELDRALARYRLTRQTLDNMGK